MDRYYKILNSTEFDSDEVIFNNYTALKSKYLEDRFLEGEEGNLAAKKLTELEIAYKEVCAYRSQSKDNRSETSLFVETENAIKSGNLQLAQEKLDSFDERDAEWHYYQSVVFYKKNWINESKKQLEIAIQMDGDNEKYKNALNKLNERVNATNNINPNWNKSGSNPYNGGLGEETPQLGGSGCMQWCCDMIICNTLLNCCCSCR
ncbi:MAG: hypothetical protein IKV61_01220 [Clostridia bacterium]|nr:hypothetical protein [Clostridia bacterium]